MTDRRAAAWDISVGIVEAIENDATLMSVLTADVAHDGVYSWRVPKHFAEAFPRITMRESTESPSGFFGRKGNVGSETLHIWTREVGKQGVLNIYNHLVRVLSRSVVNPDTHSIVRMSVRLVTINEDPDGITMHGVVDVGDILSLNS